MSFTDNLSKKQRKTFKRIVASLIVYAVVFLIPVDDLVPAPYALWVSFTLFLVPYLMAGYDVLARAGRNICHGSVFDENFLMSIATIGAFALVFFPDSEPHMAEGAAVMLFYQVGELFEAYAVGKSRKSIATMMDIAPDYANIMQSGVLAQVDPNEVAVGDEFVVKPGERVPLDGVVVEGKSQLDTSALTGESVPRAIAQDDDVISGCINLTGVLTVRATKPFGESTVSRILELVENASEKKARTENFITRFARYYTPVVVIAAVLLAVCPPLLAGLSWSDWVERGLIFLVVSCPCALVISVPLSFFGGIGGASRRGILVKGSNYLEMLAKVDTVVFDKTGTLTQGTFSVVEHQAAPGFDKEQILDLAAHAEAYSDHPIAQSVREGYGRPIDSSRVSNVEELSGRGVSACIDGREVLVGNDKLMSQFAVTFEPRKAAGTVLHIACDGDYAGFIVIADEVKLDSAQAIADIKSVGVGRTVMLTGDADEVASGVASQLGLDEYHARLLPSDKVDQVERLIGTQDASHALAFVGDGINDAPVLMRADVGIAMGAMGSDAAIEAADIVLMDDKPTNIAVAIRIARKTMGIVWQNIVFALAVKIIILVLAAAGIANMWLAVFGDVGVAVLAILNAMRAMRI